MDTSEVEMISSSSTEDKKTEAEKGMLKAFSKEQLDAIQKLLDERDFASGGPGDEQEANQKSMWREEEVGPDETETKVRYAGRWYGLVHAPSSRGPDVSATLPENIWSLAIIVSLGRAGFRLHQIWVYDEDYFNFFVKYCVKLLPMHVSVLMTFVVQLMFGYYLKTAVVDQIDDKTCSTIKEGEEGSDEAYEVNYILRCLCLVVLVAFALADLDETREMWRWVSIIPEYVESDEDDEDDEGSHGDLQESNGSFLTVQEYKYIDTKGPSKNRVKAQGHVFATGILARTRYIIYACVLIPKTISVCFILLYSSGIIVFASDNEDLILNAVAALFVLDVPSYTYKLFHPTVLQNELRNFPPIVVRPGGTAYNQDAKPPSYWNPKTHGKWDISPPDDLSRSVAVFENFGPYILSFCMVSVSLLLHEGWCGLDDDPYAFGNGPSGFHYLSLVYFVGVFIGVGIFYLIYMTCKDQLRDEID